MGCRTSAPVLLMPAALAEDRVPTEYEVQELRRRLVLAGGGKGKHRGGGIPALERGHAWVVLMRAQEARAAYPGLYHHALASCDTAATAQAARVILVDVPRTLGCVFLFGGWVTVCVYACVYVWPVTVAGADDPCVFVTVCV